MYVVTVLLQIKISHIGRFMQFVRANASVSLDNEPGCQQFDVCTDGARPGEVFLYEVYKGRSSFEAHLHSAHFLQFDSETVNMVESKQVTTFNRVD